MSSMTVRDIPEDLQEFLKADAAANHRSVNKQVIVALDEYRKARLAALPVPKTPEDKKAAILQTLQQNKHLIVHDPRTDIASALP